VIPKTPVCSICVANYNGVDIVSSCLDSAMAQDIGLPFEILVHDDASTDGSVEFIRQKYPHVRMLVSAKNVGFCVANNRMVAEARGRYVLLLNNDAELLPNALSALLHEAENMNRPAILGLAQYMAASGSLYDRGSLVDPFLNAVPNLNPTRTDVAMVSGACLWLPKTLWEQLGGFPEWFGTMAEDLYLCTYARLAKYPVRVVRGSGFRHHVGATLGGGKVAAGRIVTTLRRRALTERNKIFVMLACYPLPLLAFIFPLHLLLLYSEGLLLTMIKKDATLWKQVYWPLCAKLWHARKNVALLRRHVQKDRVASLVSFLKPVRWLPWKLGMLLKHGIPEVK
jgi:GT2 family glycosyltransferase